MVNNFNNILSTSLSHHQQQHTKCTHCYALCRSSLHKLESCLFEQPYNSQHMKQYCVQHATWKLKCLVVWSSVLSTKQGTFYTENDLIHSYTT